MWLRLYKHQSECCYKLRSCFNLAAGALLDMYLLDIGSRMATQVYDDVIWYLFGKVCGSWEDCTRRCCLTDAHQRTCARYRMSTGTS